MRTDLSRAVSLLLFALFLALPCTAQEQKAAPPSGSEYSGMYSFLRDGEFVQITVEEKGQVSGFVSRYGDGESDRGAFLDHFFKQGKLDGNKLVFTTETVHGVWFDFDGSVAKTEGKKGGEEAAYVLKGTLTEHATNTEKKVSSRSREVEFKSFPQDLSAAPEKRD